MKKIVTVLLIICLVFTILPDKKSVEAAFVIDDMLLLTVGTALIMAGVTFANRDKIKSFAKDCYNKMPQSLKNQLIHYRNMGMVIAHPVLMNYLRTYKTDVYEGMMSTGSYQVGGLEGHNIILRHSEYKESTNRRTQHYIDCSMTPTVGAGIFIIDTIYYPGSVVEDLVRKGSDNYLMMTGKSYVGQDIGEIRVKTGKDYDFWGADWKTIASGLPRTTDSVMNDLVYLINDFRVTTFVNRMDNVTKIAVNGNFDNLIDIYHRIGISTYRPGFKCWSYNVKASMLVNFYEVETDQLVIGDSVIFDTPVDILENDVIFGDSMASNLDLVINVPGLDSIEDLVNVQQGTLVEVEAGVTGIYGVVENIRLLISNLILTLTNFFDLTIPINWLPVTDLGEQLTMVFPFSLPWDIGRAINALIVPGELPDDMEVKMNVYDKEYQFDIVWPEFVSTMAAMTRSAVMLLFVIGMIYATGRLFGGVQ